MGVALIRLVQDGDADTGPYRDVQARQPEGLVEAAGHALGEAVGVRGGLPLRQAVGTT
ncbi:MAG: hypothetical protein AVDCRST_MAG57-2719 [uncultured Blastococcus sp.]|uniref:Uncharacterized protein n=1 Tax=uncultured Blastococcus sp. TaxID=217144 RepID=A0A6J4IUN8_9ACTN|nr:MAG: hypothetical protein AVDCRST_MAG57-2719 [uncultured Blastococcus sp.]